MESCRPMSSPSTFSSYRAAYGKWLETDWPRSATFNQISFNYISIRILIRKCWLDSFQTNKKKKKKKKRNSTLHIIFIYPSSNVLHWIALFILVKKKKKKKNIIWKDANVIAIRITMLNAFSNFFLVFIVKFQENVSNRIKF